MTDCPLADSEKLGWHLDRKVPIALIVTMAAQLGIGVWWASKLDARVTTLEQAQSIQKDRDERQDRASFEALNILRGDMRDISNKLDRVIERQSEHYSDKR